MNEALEQAVRVLRIEAAAVASLVDRIDERFEEALRLITECSGKLVLTGIGKSGQIARKIASTFSSTGTPAVYLHPAESSHGDLGVIAKNDVLLAISYGGENSELSAILGYAARRNIRLIAFCGNPNSTLARAATVFIDVSISEEACPLGLAPTTSSTASLAMGDALAMAVLKMKGFSVEDFAEFHPGGSLGRRLLTRVRDIMHTSGDQLPLVRVDSPISEVLSAMTRKDVRGVAGVVDGNGDLVGVITDGDIRRRLEQTQDPLTGVAADIMSHQPKVIDAYEMADKAMFLMDQFKIQVLFVVDSKSTNPKQPVGALNFHDLLSAKLK